MSYMNWKLHELFYVAKLNQEFWFWQRWFACNFPRGKSVLESKNWHFFWFVKVFWNSHNCKQYWATKKLMKWGKGKYPFSLWISVPNIVLWWFAHFTNNNGRCWCRHIKEWFRNVYLRNLSIYLAWGLAKRKWIITTTAYTYIAKQIARIASPILPSTP